MVVAKIAMRDRKRVVVVVVVTELMIAIVVVVVMEMAELVNSVVMKIKNVGVISQ